MKQQTIETGLCTLLLVELPEGSINPVISMGYIIFKEPNYSNWLNHEDTMNPLKMIEWEDTHDPKDDYKDGIPVRVPDGNWKLIGRLPELTEHEAKDLVDSWDSVWNDGTKVYENYLNTVPKKKTAIESFGSLLKANGVVFENTIRFHHDLSDVKDEEEKYSLMDWQQAQDKVWNRNRTYIFKQLK